MTKKEERERRIAKLRKSVQKAESKGNFDSVHHEMLRRELAKTPKAKPVESVISQNVPSDDKENHGESD
jgi:hypothetical protein